MHGDVLLQLSCCLPAFQDVSNSRGSGNDCSSRATQPAKPHLFSFASDAKAPNWLAVLLLKGCTGSSAAVVGFWLT